MKKENKVISLQLAKELQQVAREKGFKLPESEYMWLFLEQEKWEIMPYYSELYNPIFAYDTSELGEMLHQDTKDNKFPFYCSTKAIGRSDTYRGWICFIGTDWLKSAHQEGGADTEAEARGKMLIYLIENNLINL